MKSDQMNPEAIREIRGLYMDGHSRPEIEAAYPDLDPSFIGTVLDSELWPDVVPFAAAAE